MLLIGSLVDHFNRQNDAEMASESMTTSISFLPKSRSLSTALSSLPLFLFPSSFIVFYQRFCHCHLFVALTLVDAASLYVSCPFASFHQSRKMQNICFPVLHFPLPPFLYLIFLLISSLHSSFVFREK
ncbi:hypothetical protein BZA70DRAFT_128004 [Myxozyma melibiosi]|uniref:Uncharacterized protein n=1 Tax=Myxozyma melibiosi TaxID=54550 RepID=A0ABR1F8S4_9ASCO